MKRKQMVPLVLAVLAILMATYGLVSGLALPSQRATVMIAFLVGTLIAQREPNDARVPRT